jgi:hypothetical protein
MELWKYIAGAIILLLAGILIYTYMDSPAGAIVQEPSTGEVCCSFEYNGQIKSCAAPEGQSCEICDGVCASRT